MMPFTLTLVVVLVGTLGPARDVRAPAPSLWECAGGGVQQRAAAWLAEHPKYRLLRTTCRIGAPATEESL
jgi:hypothetical protein